jgi:hypothetical protein
MFVTRGEIIDVIPFHPLGCHDANIESSRLYSIDLPEAVHLDIFFCDESELAV